MRTITEEEFMETIWLNEMSWMDVEAYLKTKDIILIPIGSTEEHGPAGPLGLDTYVAIAMVEDAARQTGVISTPPIWFGDSSHHLAFPGTISIRTETLTEYTKDILRSLARHGFKKIVIVNGHKGVNLTALQSAARNLKEFEYPDLFLAIIDPLKIGAEAALERETKEHHAGELEISHIMYKFPHLIKKERIPKEEPDFEGRFSKYMKTDLFKGGISIDIPWSSREQREFTKSGAMSDASRASAEKGKRYHDKMVKEMVEFIEWLKARPAFAPGDSGGPVTSLF
jgi:creatinine amidohydrolase